MRILSILTFFSLLCFGESLFHNQDPLFEATTEVKLSGNPQNPPIILIHGLGEEASTVWEDSIKFLQDDFYVLSFDLPGFGSASKENLLYSPKNYSQFIHHLASEYLKEPYHLIGHSMGAAIALYHAHQYENDVKSLVLISAAGILHQKAYSHFIIGQKVAKFNKFNPISEHIPTDAIGGFFQKLSSFADTSIVDSQSILNSPKLRQSILRGNPSSIAAIALAQTNFNNIPNKITQSTTIVWGDKDSVAPIETGYMLHKIMPNNSLSIIKEASHLPMKTHKEEFFSHIKKHFNNFEPSKWSEPKVENIVKKTNMQNADNHALTGSYELLHIHNSNNITIRNANIDNLSIINSSVQIENTLINSTQRPIFIQNSRVTIVASNINTDINLLQSTLNLLGTKVESKSTNPFILSGQSTIIYSLCNINNTLKHGQEF